MTITASDQMTLRCPECGSDQLVHSGNPNFNDEVVCNACGTRQVVLATAIANAKSEGSHGLAAELASTAFGDVGRKSL